MALIQTNYVIKCLKSLNPDQNFELVSMTTLGDRILNVSLPKIGEKSLFTKDLEEALHLGSVDFVVHSLKDLPTCLPPGLAIGAVFEREDPRDALVLREDFNGHTLATLPPGSIVGTSSLRRTAQLSREYPHLQVVDIRGNLNTRLRKLDHHCQVKNPSSEKDFKLHPEYAALILAQAGLVRMGWKDRVSQVLPCAEMLYAVGQGALAIECRADNTKILEMLAPLNHAETYCRILAERSFLRTLGGGCSAPVAVSTNLKKFTDGQNKGHRLKILGAVWSLDGKTRLDKQIECTLQSIPQKSSPSEPRVQKGKHKLANNDVEEVDMKKAKWTAEEIEKRRQLFSKPQGVELIEYINNNLTNCEDISTENGFKGEERKCSVMNEGMDNSVEMKEDCEGAKVKSQNEKNLGCRRLKNGLSETACPENGCRESEKCEPEVDYTPKIVCCRVNKMLKKKVEPIDIENLINEHGKMFITCPYVDKMKSLPIGQDFMGLCPYFDTAKIDDDVEIAKTLAKIYKEKTISETAKKEDNKGKCPFLASQSNMEVGSTTVSSDGKCPFKSISISDKTTVDESVPLFCGLTTHFDLEIDAIKKCESLGRELADALIKNGAIDVMKVSQDYIRSSVVART